MAVWCVSCRKSFSSKQKFDEHFHHNKTTSVGKGGKLFPNPCFNSATRQFAPTLNAAEIISRQSGSLDAFINAKRRKLPAIPSDDSPFQIMENMASPIVSPTSSDTQISISLNPSQDDMPISQIESPSTSQSYVQVDSSQAFPWQQELLVKINKLEQQHSEMLQILRDLPDKHQDLVTSEKLVEKGPTEKREKDLLKKLTDARSMETIMTNSLVNEKFTIEKEPDNDHWMLCCEVCTGALDRRFGIKVDDPCYEKSTKQNLDEWFSNCKTALKKHLENDQHRTIMKYVNQKRQKYVDIKGNIKRSARYLVYYLLRTNTAFILYPTLLATVFHCGIEPGDINTSKRFPEKALTLIDEVLQECTKVWLEDQTDITISLDMGTFFGLVLLVVYYIASNKETRLAGCHLSPSKAGEPVAKLCWKICTSNKYITEELLRARVKGVVADGQFTSGNQPFKNAIRLLLQNATLVFRWDVLHLCNRAHITARGPTVYNTDVLDQNVVPPTHLARMMNYVQSEAKKWRTGIDYTGLVISATDFMRPKIFSATRLCLYEYDQIKRFIQNKHYFDVPWWIEIMSQMYLLILFSMKIMLKNAQKTGDLHSYIQRVFLGSNPEGKKSMQLCLRVAKDIVRKNSIRYLAHETTDILSVSGQRGNNVFVVELNKLIQELGDKLVPDSLINDSVLRNALNIHDIENELQRYIDSFWNEFDSRNNQTNLSANEGVAYSEAICESFFSKWDQITRFRPSLLVENVVRLARLQLEGPSPGTEVSHDLVQRAMEGFVNYSHIGERYTTLHWQPGQISKTLHNEEIKSWEAEYLFYNML